MVNSVSDKQNLNKRKGGHSSALCVHHTLLRNVEKRLKPAKGLRCMVNTETQDSEMSEVCMRTHVCHGNKRLEFATSTAERSQ